MAQEFLVVKARCTRTGATVKNQDLTGARILPTQSAIAEDLCLQLAAKMSARTGEEWTGYWELYTPSVRRST